MARYTFSSWMCLCIVYFPVIYGGEERLDDNYALSWKTNDDFVTFDIEVKTLGWVGLGLNTVGKMKGADIVVAGVKKNGDSYGYDLRGVTHDVPQADSQQDYKVVSASQNGTHTILSVRRRLDTGDTEDYKLSVGSTVTVLWAFGNDVPDNIYRFKVHTSRGFKEVTF